MEFQGSKEIVQKQIRDVLSMNIGRPVNTSATTGAHQQVGSGGAAGQASQQRPGLSMGSTIPGGGPAIVQGMTGSCILPFNKFLQVVFCKEGFVKL